MVMLYPDERPRRLVVIMRQMPDEVTHDGSNNQAGNELEESKDMEGDSWIMAWSRLRSPIECFEHVDGGQSLLRSDSEDDGVKAVIVVCSRRW